MDRLTEIFIELPTWLGDTVMATPAIEALIHSKAKVTFFGSFASTALFENHPKKHKIIIDESKKSFFRFFYMYRLSHKINANIVASFRSSFYTKVLLFFLNIKKSAHFRQTKEEKHQVLKYLDFVEKNFTCKTKNKDLKLYFSPNPSPSKALGLNPGATYGSAKRWYPKYFAEVAKEFADDYEIIIFGGSGEKDMAKTIEKCLAKENIKCQNLAGKTTIKELCEKIASLSLFITNDSGPMHIAAAFKVPTIALFGPTKFKETSPWQNPNATLLHKNLSCMPCMKRVCPIKTHECMRDLTPNEVIREARKLVG